MKDEDIIRMANEAGWDVTNLDDGFGERLKRFVRALERQPLSDGWILGMWPDTGYPLEVIRFARAIERWHGIGVYQTTGEPPCAIAIRERGGQ